VSYPIYVVDAFTSRAFAGNPAGVCLLDKEADATWMQSVAMEMNHAETAFVRRVKDGFELRWFTPSLEVDLCGHATLASAHVLWAIGRLPEDQAAKFHTKSGVLVATKEDQIRLDFPAEPPEAAALSDDVRGLNPVWTGKNRMDWMIEVATEAEVRGFSPDFDNIESLGMRGLQVTAAGASKYDFISRFFAPQAGIPEDPVTGSAHCCLGPYWGAKLGKDRMLAFQASPRAGEVGVELRGARVGLYGDAVITLEGVLRC